MKRWALVPLVLLLTAAQSSFFMPMSLWGVRPDLILVLVASAALVRGPVVGGIYGIIAGFFLDVAGGRLIGLGALVKGLAGLGTGLAGQRVFRENAFVPVLFVFGAALMDRGLYYIGAKIFGVHFVFQTNALSMIVPGSWYDALASVLFYPLFSRLIQWAHEDVGTRLNRAAVDGDGSVLGRRRSAK